MMAIRILLTLILKGFFDEVQHYKLLQLIYNRVKCPTTLWLIRKWLKHQSRSTENCTNAERGMPQGSPLVLFYPIYYWTELDKYLKSKGLKFVRYADDFSIYAQSKSAAQKVGNEVYMF
ncbi:reverse transcriptase domain-containing protein [Algoriphagus halophilus]|uniref:reverse transcriptase domain-containing protein n=1 Tax=Algoriphagus halophilus TaxID=226505 RepID=UPI00358F0A8E